MARDKIIFIWLSVAVLAISAWLLVSTIFGYGHLVLSVPSGATVVINGHSISDASKSLKLRPGTYHISTTSARYFSTYESVHVSSFRTTNHTVSQQKRTPESIAYSAEGASAAGLPPVSNSHWVGDTWIVEAVGFSTPSVLVAHYEHDRWNKVYETGDTLDTTNIPAGVVQQVNSMEGSIRANLH